MSQPETFRVTPPTNLLLFSPPWWTRFTLSFANWLRLHNLYQLLVLSPKLGLHPSCYLSLAHTKHWYNMGTFFFNLFSATRRGNSSLDLHSLTLLALILHCTAILISSRADAWMFCRIFLLTASISSAIFNNLRMRIGPVWKLTNQILPFWFQNLQGGQRGRKQLTS